MSKAKVTKEFDGKPDDEIVSRTIAVGEVIDGDLAKVAIEQKWASPVGGKSAPEKDKGGK